ncbi:Phage portal protein [Gemmata sp. SH-PL17]|uniref:phage portal protein n=1 Tax=Gemmata sp. SH-PL17 TaxID=1630693 RepID=UPI00078DE312|nr:phage portal protein [Gemmata sp. SH-PL17]AMV25499.1 Phage portal protein [Gemmata sp. SH-PL17]
MAGTSLFPEPYREPERDPVQLQQGSLYLYSVRHPPPGSWTDNRLEQANHYRGLIFLALDAVQEAIASAAVCCEKQQRRDRTTFGAGAVSYVKALSETGGAGSDEDYAPVHDHPLAELINCPNKHDTFGSLLSYGTMQWGLTGNGPFWFVPGKNHNRPVELYPLVEPLLQVNSAPSLQYPEGSWRVTPYYPNGTGWAYGGLANRVAYSAILPGAEVRKMQSPHPLTRTDGYSRLTACGVQFDIMEAIDKSRHAAFMHGTRIGTLVQLPPGMGEDAVQAVSAQFTQKYAGADKAGITAVVSGTPDGKNGLDVKQLNESPREMDYAQSWEQAVKFVLAAFGTPPSITGLNPSTGYAEFYAAQTQFHYRLSQLARRWSDFFTRTLAWPWSRRRGEYRIKIEVPKPRNDEAKQQLVLQLAQMGVMLTNEVRQFADLKPVRYGDLPPPLFVQKIQGEEFPESVQQPGMPNDVDGATLPDAEGAEDRPADDQGDETQNAVTAAALETLGVPQDDQGDDSVQKAMRQKRQEGQVWTGNDGLKYTKRNGKIILAPHPAGADGRYPSRHDGATYANEGDRDSDDRHFARERRGAQNQLDKVRAALTDAMKRHDAKQSHIEQLRQQLAAATKRSNRAQAKLGRPEANAVAQPVSPPAPANHDRLASALLNGQPAVRLFTAGNGPVQGHTIRDGAGLQRFVAAGGVLPDVVYQRAAQKVQATTPQAQQTISTADQWAATQANRHADRVAQHFGITRERAHALLVSAIRATAAHAAKNGGAMPNVTIRDKQTGKTAKLSAKPKGPTSGAPPKPSNPAGKGSLPERPQGARVRKGVRPEFAALVAKLTQKG